MFPRPVSPSPLRIWLARFVAIAADAIQIAVWPAFAAGAVSPFEDLLDVIVAGILTYLVGWHIAFVPSFIVKLMPVADLAPTWTIAILVATRNSRAAPPPEFIDVPKLDQ
jgi:hypothetical protein